MLYVPSLEQLAIGFLCIVFAAIFHHIFILRNGPDEPPLVKGPLPFLGCALPLQSDFKSFLMQNAENMGAFTRFTSLEVESMSSPIQPLASLPIFDIAISHSTLSVST
jgi:hypothetical protein